MASPIPPLPHSPSLFQPVLSADAMREADRYTIEAFGLPGFTLMETAGRGAADHITRSFAPIEERTVTCLCGKGNNGGDGLVVARLLYERGAHVRVYTLGGAHELSEDAARNLQLLEQLDKKTDSDRLILQGFEHLNQLENAPPPDLFVDALLGTGLTSELRSPVREMVDWLNEQARPIVALDTPTGLHSDTGRALGTAVEADLTITMAALKTGLLINDGPRYAGRTEIVPIGIPSFVLRRACRKDGSGLRPTDEIIRQWLPARPHDAHKYSAGLTVVAAGSPGLTGAPVMASTAAARIGAGAVVCACPTAAEATLAAKMTEVMTTALPTSDAGGILAREALEALEPRLSKADALLVGPGLGRHADTQQFIRGLLTSFNGPAVIDADGLNALADRTDLISDNADGQWILTPHEGEFKRLAGSDVDLDDRLRTVRRYAQQWNCYLLLKGMPSLLGCPDGTTFVNATGGPALASAGTGDVLAGQCVGLLAQGLSPRRAAVCALHIGGAAADQFGEHNHPNAMMAMDLLDELPRLLHERFRH